MSHSLSPEQKVAVDAILNKASSDIKYFDLNTAFQSVFQVILQSINDHKKVLLQLPVDNNQSASIIELIHHYNLDNLTINLDKNTPIPESDIITLRSVVKKDVDTKPIIENILAKEKLKSTLTKTINYYKALDTTILTNSTFRNFAASTILNGTQNKSILNIENININLELTAQEFYNIKREVNDASENYQREFDLFDQLDIINKDIWAYEQNEIEELRLTLESLRHESNELVKSYNKTFATLENDAASNINKNISLLLSTIKTHQQECTSYHINETYKNPIKANKFSLFGKKETTNSNSIYVAAFDSVSQIISDISSDWYEEIPAPQTEHITFDFINNFLSKCIEDTPAYARRIKTSLTHSIHRINRINTSSDAVISLDKKLTEFISRIVSLNIVQHEFNANTISFTKQMQMSKQISEMLDQCSNLIGKETSYTKWKNKETSNSYISNLLISELKSIPRNQWNTQLSLWYDEQIKTSIISDLTTDGKIIEHLRSTNNKFLESEVIATTNKLQLSRIAAANQLKSTSKELHNTLFKKKTLNANSWNDIALLARPFLQGFFPIHTNSDLTGAVEYDLTISFNRRPVDANELSPTHYISPITPEDIEDMSESNDLFLYLNNYNYNATLDELSNSEKLKASKKLAKFILSLNQQVKIYQLKTGNIISLLPPNDDAQFENRMDQYGIKSIDTSGALYDKLTESILFTNRQPYLLIKDEMINPELHQHLLWQADIIQIFKKAGYRILSLNTDKQLIDNDQAFESILSPLMESNKNETRPKNIEVPSTDPSLEIEAPIKS